MHTKTLIENIERWRKDESLTDKMIIEIIYRAAKSISEFEERQKQ